VTDTNANDERITDAGTSGEPGEFFEEGTFNDWLGLEVDRDAAGRVVLSTGLDRRKQNPGGVMHGGVTASLIDVAGGMAIGLSEEVEGDTRATTSLDVEYLRPITADPRAVAEVLRVGSTNAVSRVDVFSTAPDGTEKLVAVGTATYQLG
jgi:uncharacterized protein (TIGR00369 family)